MKFCLRDGPDAKVIPEVRALSCRARTGWARHQSPSAGPGCGAPAFPQPGSPAQRCRPVRGGRRSSRARRPVGACLRQRCGAGPPRRSCHPYRRRGCPSAPRSAWLAAKGGGLHGSGARREAATASRPSAPCRLACIIPQSAHGPHHGRRAGSPIWPPQPSGLDVWTEWTLHGAHVASRARRVVVGHPPTLSSRAVCRPWGCRWGAHPPVRVVSGPATRDGHTRPAAARRGKLAGDDAGCGRALRSGGSPGVRGAA